MNKDENEGSQPASFDHDKEYQPHGPLVAAKVVPLLGAHKEHMAALATQSSWDEHVYPTSHLGQGFAFEEGKEFLARKMLHKKISKARTQSMSESVASNDNENLINAIRLEEGNSLPKVQLTKQPAVSNNGLLICKIFGCIVIVVIVVLVFYFFKAI